MGLSMGDSAVQGTVIYQRGDKVRINTPDEVDHGAVVEVIGMHTSVFEPNGDKHVWVMMPFDYAWLYKVTEVEAVSKQQEGE